MPECVVLLSELDIPANKTSLQPLLKDDRASVASANQLFSLEGNFVNVVDAREGDPRLASQPSANGHRWTRPRRAVFRRIRRERRFFFLPCLSNVLFTNLKNRFANRSLKTNYTYLAERNRNNYEVNEQKSLQAIFPAD